MPLALFALFVAMPLAELAVLIKVGGLIGLGPTLLIIVITAIIGTALVRHQGLAVWMRAQRQLDEGKTPLAEALTRIALLVAALLLLTPGFITDAAGFLLLIPALRDRLGSRLARWLLKHAHVRTYRAGGPGAGPADAGPDTIEGDYEDVTSGRSGR